MSPNPTASPRAFTLIETMIAISVLMFAVVGPFFVIEGVLQSSYAARDQLIASALAEEGIEYVYEIRDGNYLSNLHTSGTLTWMNGLDGNNGPNCYPSNGGTYCVVDPSQQTVTACSNSTCSTLPLYLSPTNLYTQATSGNTLTKFTRVVKLTSIGATETTVTVTVSWTEHGTHSVVLTDDLRNWL